MIPSISTMPARRRLGVVLVLLSVLVGSSAHAGVDGGSRLPTEYRSWKLETAGGQELRISQIYVPLVGTVFLRPSTRVVVSAAAGRSRYERPRVSTEGEIGANVTDALSGATDVKLQLYQKLWRNRLVLLGGINLPTGKRELSQEELEVMQAAVHPLLGMRLKQYGRGLDLNAGAALSLPLAPGVELGAGLGYVLSGKYTLAEGGGEYDPTPETSGSLALELASAGKGRSLQLRVTGRTYQEDKLEGRRIFEEGDQLEASFRIVDRIGRFHGSLFTQGVWKKDDTSYGRTESDLGRVSTTTPGTGFVTHGSVLYGLSDRIDAGFTGDWKRFQVSDNAFYNGDAFGVGPTIGTRLGDGRSIRLEGLWLTGSAGSGDSQLDLSGFAVTAGLYWRL